MKLKEAILHIVDNKQLAEGREKKALKNAIETLYQLTESINLGV